jgi:hypothetical protein
MADDPLDPTLTALETLAQAQRREHPDKIGMSEALLGPFPCICLDCRQSRQILALIAAYRQMREERDSARQFVENWCAIRNVSPADTAAALRGDFALLDACEPYLKDGETPAECIERNRKDIDAVLRLLAQEKQRAEQAESALAALRAESADDDRLIARLSELLTGVANAIKGDPPPDVLHDWSQLPRLSSDLVAERDALRAEQARLTEALRKAHEFVCNVDIHGDWWDAQRRALADELDRLLAPPVAPER